MMECTLLACSSSWNPEGETALNSTAKIIEDLTQKNTLELLDEDCCISLVPPTSATKGDCDILLTMCKCDRPLKYDHLPSGDGPSNIFKASNSASENQCKFINSYIDTVILVSEAKLAEVFITPFEEYFATFHSELVSDFDDAKIYKTTVYLKKPQKHVLLKLKNIFTPESLWIYGIFVNKVEFIPSSSSNILGSLNQTIPFKPDSIPRDLLNKILMLSIENNNFAKNCEKKLPESLKQPDINFVSPVKNVINFDGSPEIVQDKDSFLEKFIDQKIKETESRIIGRLEAKIEESHNKLSNKLEKIENLLETLIGS